MQFKDFLLNENRVYLGQKIGDILSAVHDLQQDEPGMGERHYVRFAEKVVTAIRRVLHSPWPRSEQQYLKDLQKIGVALAKTIDEKGELKQIMPSIKTELEQLSGKLGMPVNQMGVQQGAEPAQLPDETPEGDTAPEQQQQQQQPPNPPMEPQIGGQPPMPGTPGQPPMPGQGQPPQQPPMGQPQF